MYIQVAQIKTNVPKSSLYRTVWHISETMQPYCQCAAAFCKVPKSELLHNDLNFVLKISITTKMITPTSIL